MSERTATWPPCEVCGQPVADPQEGVLSISTLAARRRARGVVAWEEEHSDQIGETKVTRLGLGALAALPDEIPWVWTHAACAPEANDYAIDGDRIDTPARALGWTLHLAEKWWFTATNWRAVMARLELSDPTG